MSRFLQFVALFALVVLATGIGPARAEEEDSAPLAFRIFSLGTLSPGRSDFIPGQPPWASSVLIPRTVARR